MLGMLADVVLQRLARYDELDQPTPGSGRLQRMGSVERRCPERRNPSKEEEADPY